MTRVLLALLLSASVVSCQRETRVEREPTGTESVLEDRDVAVPPQRLGQKNAAEQMRDQSQLDYGDTDAADELAVRGEVKQRDGNRLSIGQTGGAELTLELKPDTQVLINGEPIRREILKEGTQVRASYEDAESGNVATRIEVLRLPSPSLKSRVQPNPPAVVPEAPAPNE